jgi:hypothetical protein
MPTLDPAAFDPTKNYAAAAFMTLGGHQLGLGAPITITDEPSAPGEVTAANAAILFSGRKIVAADQVRPTPVESPLDAARRLTEVEPLDDDKFLIRAPWLAEALTVEGADQAALTLADVRAEGIKFHEGQQALAAETGSAEVPVPLGFELIEAGSNGWYEITGPGLSEPERIRGRDNAEQRLVQLRGEQPVPTEQTPDQPPSGGPAVADA